MSRPPQNELSPEADWSSRAAILRSGALAVTFHPCGDRVRHTIELMRLEQSLPILESIEGLPDDAWPPSPALQQVHLETRKGGRETVALLVGMAGTSHWSLGVERDSTAAGSLTFDLACRLRSIPERLAASYRALVPARFDSQRGTILFDAGGILVELQGADAARGGAQIKFDGSMIGIQPRVEPRDAPTTVRWSYRVSVPDTRP